MHPQIVQDLIHARDGQLAESAKLVELLDVNSDPNPARCFWDDHHGARVWRSRALDQTGSEVMIEGCVHLFGKSRVDAMWPGSDRRAALRYQNFEGHQRAQAKIRFGDVKNIRKIAEDVA